MGGGFKVGVWLGFALLSLGAKWFANKLYQRKKLYEKMYDCEVCFSDQKMSARGFLDSGNLAKKNDLPICFLSPDLFYDLFSAYILDGDEGQVCDEITLVTMAGEKKTKIFAGEIALEGRKRRVYYAPSAHMIGREYNVLLHSEILEDRE